MVYRKTRLKSFSGLLEEEEEEEGNTSLGDSDVSSSSYGYSSEIEEAELRIVEFNGPEIRMVVNPKMNAPASKFKEYSQTGEWKPNFWDDSDFKGVDVRILEHSKIKGPELRMEDNLQNARKKSNFEEVELRIVENSTNGRPERRTIGNLRRKRRKLRTLKPSEIEGLELRIVENPTIKGPELRIVEERESGILENGNMADELGRFELRIVEDSDKDKQEFRMLEASKRKKKTKLRNFNNRDFNGIELRIVENSPVEDRKTKIVENGSSEEVSGFQKMEKICCYFIFWSFLCQ